MRAQAGPFQPHGTTPIGALKFLAQRTGGHKDPPKDTCLDYKLHAGAQGDKGLLFTAVPWLLDPAQHTVGTQRASAE